jgi:hypothetical protein
MAINIQPSHRGLFTQKAKAAGMSVQAYAAKVLSNPQAPVTLRREAQFAKNAKSFKHNTKQIKKAGAMMRKSAGVKG